MESHTNFQNLPREILRHILSFIHIDELSKSVSWTSQTLYEIVHSIVGGRFRLDRNGMITLLAHNEIMKTFSYIVVQRDGCRLESTLEWLEVNDCLLDEEKVVGTGIICSSISYDLLFQAIERCTNLKYFFWVGNKDSQNIPKQSRRELLEDDNLLSRLPELLQISTSLEYISCCNDELNFGINSKCISNQPSKNPNSSKLKMLRLHNFDFNVSFALSQQYPDTKVLSITEHQLSDHMLSKMLLAQNDVKQLSLSLSKPILKREAVRDWLETLSLETFRLACNDEEKGIIRPNPSPFDLFERPSSREYDVNIDDIVIHLNNLRAIELGKHITINDSKFLTFIQNSPNIEELVFKEQKFGVNTLISIIACCKDIKKIEFSDCQMVTDDMLKQIGASCSQLIDLNINSKWKITDHGFCDIVEKCLLLQKLDVSGTRLTNKSFSKLGENLKYLNHLKMRRCDYLTDESLSIIVQHIPNLLTLDIGWCSQLTKEALNSIAKYSKNLIYLSMPGLYDAVFSVETIANLLINCKKMKYLNFLDYRDALHTKLFGKMLDKLFADIKSVRSSFNVIIEEERGGLTHYIDPFST